MDSFTSFVRENIVLFDIIFIIFITYFSIQCFTKGFFISLMSFLKWVLALVITIILVPKIEPYVSDYIDNEYIAGIGLGIAVYIITLFVLILAGKSMGRLFSYTGMGSVDKVFGFFFGIFNFNLLNGTMCGKRFYFEFIIFFKVANIFNHYHYFGAKIKPISRKLYRIKIYS